jgi:DNA polymerase-1
VKYLYIEQLEKFNKSLSYYQSTPSIGLDIETTGKEPNEGDIRLVQISDGNKTIVADIFHILRNVGREGYSLAQNFYLWSELKKLLENPKIKVVIHNSKFEQKWLMAKMKIIVNSVFDTFLAAQLLDYNEDHDPARGWGLHAVGKRYLQVDLDKTEQKSDWSRWILTDHQLDYAALDPYYLPKLREIMLSLLESDGLVSTAVLDFECVPCIANAELKGVPVDREKYEKEIKSLEELHKKASASLQDKLRPTSKVQLIQPKFFDLPETNYADVLLGSHSQMLEALSKLGVPCVASSDVEKIAYYEIHKKPYAIGTGAKALAPLEGDYPIVKFLQDFRGVDKQLSAFGPNFLEHLRKDSFGVERIHTSFQILGASTGRMSSKNPNMQQIPNGSVTVGDINHVLQFRKCFVAPKGRKFVISDYSQIELRIAAEFSREPVLIDAFANGHDPHAATASSCFNVPYEDCIEGGQYYHTHRAYSKRINFGIIYGQGAYGLSTILQISKEEAEKILQTHRANHPVLWSYLDRQKMKAKTNLCARTASGRLIRFRAPDKDEFGNPDRQQLGQIARVGTNQPIQGTSVDMLKIALKLIFDRLKGMDAYVINTVHDEIMVECDEKIAPEVKQIVQKSMEEAGQKFLKIVSVVADAKIIDTWGEK